MKVKLGKTAGRLEEKGRVLGLQPVTENKQLYINFRGTIKTGFVVAETKKSGPFLKFRGPYFHVRVCVFFFFYKKKKLHKNYRF